MLGATNPLDTTSPFLKSILPLLALNKRRLQVSIQGVNQHTLKNIRYDGLEELWTELDARTKCDSDDGS